MSLEILADEGLNGNIVRELRERGYSADWVLEISPGISDEEVIEVAKNNKQILITEDKDFGEWVFSHQIRGLTIIFLRYEKMDYPKIINYLDRVLEEMAKSVSEDSYEFITINKNKIRRRII